MGCKKDLTYAFANGMVLVILACGMGFVVIQEAVRKIFRMK